MRNLIALFFLSLLCACSSKLTGEDALRLTRESSAFSTPFFAPFNVGSQVLTSENYKNPDAFIKGKYGMLIDAGLVNIKMVETNSWRSVIAVELTPAGMRMADMRRSDHDHIYVTACSIVADSILSMERDEQGKTIRAVCRFHETAITPFGRYLGFAEGKPHQVPLAFVHSRGGWKLAPVQQDFFPGK